MANLHIVDWIVISFYLVAMIGLSGWITRSIGSKKDYFVTRDGVSPGALAVSILATQCSTNSILGAPAFVAFAAGGGLIWLQYELALPIAMLISAVIFMPIIFNLKIISVYEYLDFRFGLKTKLLLSGFFLLSRTASTAVLIFGVASVIQLITGLNFFWAVMLFGLVTVIYDLLGGIKAVIYSDIAQMTILCAVLGISLYLLAATSGGIAEMLASVSQDRVEAINFSNHGLGDGEDFAFWPMFFGGIFLYVSYYMCDQSQVQRGLCARSQSDAQKILILNGVFRFPFVLLYCLIGVGLANYAAENAVFFEQLSVNGKNPNFNLAVPVFFLNELPMGMLGLSLVALLAAAMSSLDSVINSLSAVSMEDFVKSTSWGNTLSDQQELWLCRCFTITWGGMAVLGSFWVGDIASTVIVAVNKIGSVTNGPVLAVFLIGLLSRKTTGTGVVLGFFVGIFVNIALWQLAPNVSWLWWNVFGFAGTFLTALLVAQSNPKREVVGEADKILFWSWVRYKNLLGGKAFTYRFYFLIFYTAILIVVLAFFNLAGN